MAMGYGVNADAGKLTINMRLGYQSSSGQKFERALLMSQKRG
jgi:hypothetical protein